MLDFNQQALLGLMSHLVFIPVTWWALQALHIEKAMKKGKVMQARALLILLTIAISGAVSNFFLDYLIWSRQLPFLF
ncbi:MULTISPECIES: DUF1146 family protein [Metabacillus]|uniref:Membrane protein n=1 Tax=Metabacillus indicus TaxID=246786 RepID=A0A084GY12_METID|nr:MULTISPECIES: DUF1146 family protein [Metabacillus]KEZ48857.1 membrane protein [Metabacillus indicus LMG 22858]KEZ52224.1 membrane protein [Metabacillus indicus]MDX8289052.1 DUF1146 family protein [Metabacillus indicus]